MRNQLKIDMDEWKFFFFTVVREVLCNNDQFSQFRNLIGPYQFLGISPRNSTTCMCVCDFSMLNHWGEGLSYYLKLTWGQAIKESILWPPEITWQNTMGIFETGTTVTPHLVSEPDPSKIEKEGLVNEAGWKCTVCSVCRCTSDWLWLAFWCVFIGNVNHTRIIFTFCFELYTKWER